MNSVFTLFGENAWVKTAVALVVAVALIVTSAVSFLSSPQVAQAATTILSDGFGSGSSLDDIPGWEEKGNESDSSTRAQNPSSSGNDSVSPEGGRFAKIGQYNPSQGQGGDGFICRQINASGYDNLTLQYYWRGDSDAESSDLGRVEYRTNGSCESADNTWTGITSHQMNNSSWSSLQTLSLPDALDNATFFIRFRADASQDDEFFRVDGISIQGDVIPTTGTITVLKLIDADGNTATTNDQSPAQGWIYNLANTSKTTGIDGKTEPLEVQPNTYSVAEVIQDGYEILSAHCYNDEQVSQGSFVPIDSVTGIEVSAGENVTCTFINALDHGTLKVKKVFINNTGPKSFADFQFSIPGATPSLLSASAEWVETKIPAGENYAVEELGLGGGYALTDDSVDCSGVMLSGQVKECTIENTYTPEGGQGGNPEEPDQCVVTQTIVSDADTKKDGIPAVFVDISEEVGNQIHLAWTALISGVNWIWSSNPPIDTVNDLTETLTREFTITGTPLGATLEIAADNSYSVMINGFPVEPVCESTDENNFSSTDVCVIPAEQLITGVNTISFTIRNWAQSGGTAQSNPAGLLYKLTVNEDTCVEEPVVNTCVLPESNDAQNIVLGTSSEPNIQSILDGVYPPAGTVDADDDQYAYESWTASGVNLGFTAMFLKKHAGDHIVFGYYLNGDLGTFVPLFKKGAHPSFPLMSESSEGDSASFTIPTFTDIGFAIHTAQGETLRVYATESALNTGGEDHTVVYNPVSNEYILAFEDRPLEGADRDHNDFVVKLNVTGCDDLPQCVIDEELLENGGFENPTVLHSAGWNIFPSGTSGLGWMVEWFGGSLTYNTQNRPDIANIELQKHGLSGWNAVGGAGQWTELDADWVGPDGSLNGEPGSVVIKQSIFTEVGETYAFSFDFSPRPGTAAGQNVVEVLVNGSVIGTVGPLATAGNQTEWNTYSFNFVANSLLSVVALRDAGTPNDSLGTFVDNASLMCTAPVQEPQFATVTLCKVNEQGAPLSGWTLLLENQEEAVDSLVVPSETPLGADSIVLTAGVPYVALVNGVWLNDRDPDNHVDAEYSTENGWVTSVDGFTGYPTEILELQVNNTFGNWGAYNSLHSYAQGFTLGADGTVNFRIFDGDPSVDSSNPNPAWYGDNSGSLNVTIVKGYAGITDEEGCVTFQNVPYGTYDLSEMLQDGWVADAENPTVAVVDSSSEVFTLTNYIDTPDPTTATIHATKIVCENESYLPNWGAGSAEPVTAATAANFLASVNADEGPDHCWLAPDWSFQWVLNSDSSSNPSDNLITPADEPWTTFGLTGNDGVITANVPAGERVWVREILKNGYVPFSGQNTTQNVSAELYCSSDALNYDNWDFIDPVVAGETYYCVALNALQDGGGEGGSPESCEEGYIYDSELAQCVPEEIDENNEGDGGGGGSGPEIQSFGANGPISGLGGGPLGQVLGASTGEVLGESCGLYMDKPIRFNRNNDAEQVRKLQTFLNKWLGLSIPVTGFYGPVTYGAVLQFQTQYANTILTPWGLTSPTGIVYVTTLRQINMLECPVLALELPPLIPWTN